MISWKMDGLTVVLTYRDGKLYKAVTRGNGEVGEVITNNAKVFKNGPVQIAYQGELILRGEAVIGYKDFEKINQEIEDVDARYKNPRNLCSGSVRQLNNQITAKRNVMFYAFTLVEADGVDFQNSRACQMEWLKSQGFTTVEYYMVTRDTVEDEVAKFSSKISENDFPSDGLVLTYDDIAYGRSLGRTAKFPRDSFAFKWQDEIRETVLREIEWSPSRTGLINPVAIFDPVELEGTTVSRASVHNISIMEELELGIGDKIEVYKANMIIPQIAENLTRIGVKDIPERCPVCQGETKIGQGGNAKALYCMNPEFQAKHVKAFALFVSRDALNIEGLSEATLEKFISTKVIFDSFHISEGYQYTNSFLQSILDVMPNVTQTLLREHYRCHPKIINFCNQKFYRGELIIMTTDKGEEDVLSVVKTVAGNHERNHYSQRQIDVIKNEIIPKYVSNPEETGIIAPYKNQVEALSKEITDIDAATVHKFQGKEKENIIISTVDDEISDFADDPYLINVAVSRAKKKLMLVVTGNEQSRERNITELIDYIQYNNFEVTESKIYSIFDYLYKQYADERMTYLKKHKKVSEYDSENLMYSLIEDIISANKYSSLDVVCHFPLNMLIKNPELLNEQECQYAMNPATHLDFLIYNRIGKKPVLAIEVDGYEYHKEDTVQASRDLLKNHIMELYEIPLLRFMTNGSGEREKIVEMLDKSVG